MVNLEIRSRAEKLYSRRSLTTEAAQKKALGNWLLVAGKTTPRREFARLNSTPNETKAPNPTPISAHPRENRAWTGPTWIPWGCLGMTPLKPTPIWDGYGRGGGVLKNHSDRT
jgi:hypothetical protein